LEKGGREGFLSLYFKERNSYQKTKKNNQRAKSDDLVKSQIDRHPGESRGPERLEMTGFRLSPE
jgi:hypothetical protein